MKNSPRSLLLLVIAAFVLSFTTYSVVNASRMATCTGAKNCKACKNCRYCKHCAKEGGTCGVCRK